MQGLGPDSLKEFNDKSAQFSAIAKRFVVDDDESRVLAEEMMNVANKIIEEVDTYFDDAIEFSEALTAEYSKVLTRAAEQLRGIERILNRKIEEYGKQREAAGEKDIWEQIEKARKEAAEKHRVSNKQDKFLKDLNKLSHFVVMQRAESILSSSMKSSKLERWLSEYSKSKEETKRAYVNLQKARNHLRAALEDLPPFYAKRIHTSVEELSDIITNLKKPAQRPENVLLNDIVEILMEYFLGHNYSKRSAYAHTGELLVKYGLLEDSDYLSDKVRHRYLRRKKNPDMSAVG